MLTESVDHRFRQATVGMAWDHNHLETHSLTCLLINGDWLLKMDILRQNQVEAILPLMTQLASHANRLHLLMRSGKVLEQRVGPETLLWPLPEITICYN